VPLLAANIGNIEKAFCPRWEQSHWCVLPSASAGPVRSKDLIGPLSFSCDALFRCDLLASCAATGSPLTLVASDLHAVVTGLAYEISQHAPAVHFA